MANVAAYFQDPKFLSLDASTDLSSDQYKGITYSSGEAALCTVQGEFCLGVLVNKPDASPKSCQIQYLGIGKVQVGGTVAQGNALCVNSSSLFIKSNDIDEMKVAIALSDASASGTVIPAIIYGGAPGGGGGTAVTVSGFQTFTSSANYSSAGQYTAMKLHTTGGQIVKCATAGEACIGILQNAPASLGEAEVCTFGECTAMAGAAGFTAGDELAIEVTSGEIVTATAGDFVIGYAQATVTSGNTGLILFTGNHSQTAQGALGAALTTGSAWIGAASVAAEIDLSTDTAVLIGDGSTAAMQTLSSDVTMTNAGVVTIANDVVSAAKMGSTVAGSDGAIFKSTSTPNAVAELDVGTGEMLIGTAGDVSVIDVSTDTAVLIGDASTAAMQTFSQDVTMTNTGVVTIANDVVSAAKMGSTVAGSDGCIFKSSSTPDAVSELDVPAGNIIVGATNDVSLLDCGATAGAILVDSGTAPAMVSVSGDATLAAGGALTLAKSLWRSATTTWTAAEVIAGNATPLVLLDFSVLQAAGTIAAGDCLIFQHLVANIYGGAANYDQNENSIIKYQTAGGGATCSLTLANWFNGSGPGTITDIKQLATVVVPDADEDLVWTMSASPKNAAGDRTLSVTIWYTVFTPAT